LEHFSGATPLPVRSASAWPDGAASIREGCDGTIRRILRVTLAAASAKNYPEAWKVAEFAEETAGLAMPSVEAPPRARRVTELGVVVIPKACSAT
jgi:hypothetical protein